MNNKVTLQDLADQLSAISGQSKKLSEGFLRALTEIVEDALAKDGIAKVKGIGTFKIVAIEERKSVSVTDGSAVIIPAHKKITFTPEKELKEAVNKPYEDLETYVLPSDGPVDGPFIDEDDDEGDGEDLTSSTDYTNINPVDTNAGAGSASVSNITTNTSESTVAQTPAPTIETPQTSQPVSTPSPTEPITPTNNYASTTNAYTTPSSGAPAVEPSITTNNTTESASVQSPIQETTTPPVYEPTPSPEPTITNTTTPTPEATIVQQPVAETCAPVGPTPTEEIQQTAENTIPSENTQPTTAYTAPGESSQQTTAYTTPSEGTQQTTAYTTPSEGTQQTTAYTTPGEGTQQTTANTAPVESSQQTTAYTTPGEGTQPTTANTAPSESTTKEAEPITTQNPQGTVEQPTQSEVKEETVQDAATTNNEADATAEKQAETTANATASEPTAQSTDATQPAAQAEQTQPAAAIVNEHSGKHKHHKKKKKERNKSLLAIIIILALLIIACLIYALRSDKGFANGINDLKGKITSIFNKNEAAVAVKDSVAKADSISKEQAEVDEFFEEKTEDMYEAAQADQEFPTEVVEEQNWDWFEEGVKKFIKKEYPKLNFEVKGEPSYDTIRRGQTLTSMSRKYYNGVKDFWVYIYLYNKDVIRRPDDVSVGTPIKIPQLDETVIDPSSYESINAAKDVKESYLRLFN